MPEANSSPALRVTTAAVVVIALSFSYRQLILIRTYDGLGVGRDLELFAGSEFSSLYSLPLSAGWKVISPTYAKRSDGTIDTTHERASATVVEHPSRLCSKLAKRVW